MKTLIENYRELKEQYKDKLILLRSGNFYTSLDDDAKIVSEVCGYTLINKNGYKEASFPHHALDWCLPKLIRHGHKIAITEI